VDQQTDLGCLSSLKSGALRRQIEDAGGLKGAGVNTVQGTLSPQGPGQEPSQRELELPATDFEERWTGAYIFENEWQSFRTRQKRALDMTTAAHAYEAPGRYTIAVKVIDIFGNDTMTLVPVTVG
jgi:site-specific DNA-methyltransferase (adenine-specific)/adenine-specific DNA-methyltransferase